MVVWNLDPHIHKKISASTTRSTPPHSLACVGRVAEAVAVVKGKSVSRHQFMPSIKVARASAVSEVDLPAPQEESWMPKRPNIPSRASDPSAGGRVVGPCLGEESFLLTFGFRGFGNFCGDDFALRGVFV